MSDLEHMGERLSAYLDGELPEAEAREVEAWLEEHPEALEELGELQGVGAALRGAADAWERELSFDGFYEKVEARLGPAPAPTPQKARRPGGFLAWLLGHPALTAAATVLVVLGAGSYLYLNVPGSGTDADLPALHIRGGAAVIQDLSFENSSAVVYRTESDVTVIWLTEDGS